MQTPKAFQASQIRTTTDGFLSIYDFLGFYKLEIDSKSLWKELIENNPTLKSISQVKQFFQINKLGKLTPHRTISIHVGDLNKLIHAIDSWRLPKNISQTVKAPVEPAPIPSIQSVKPKPVLKSATDQPETPKKEPLHIIAGEEFYEAWKLEQRFRYILRDTEVGEYVNEKDEAFILDLLSRHYSAKRSLQKGVYGIKVEHHPDRAYKNFAVHLPDRMQTLSIKNYLNPAKKPYFKIQKLNKPEPIAK